MNYLLTDGVKVFAEREMDLDTFIEEYRAIDCATEGNLYWTADKKGLTDLFSDYLKLSAKLNTQ